MLGDRTQPRRGVGIPADVVKMLLRGVARQRLDLGSAGVSADRLDLLGIKALRDQRALALGDDSWKQ